MLGFDCTIMHPSKHKQQPVVCWNVCIWFNHSSHSYLLKKGILGSKYCCLLLSGSTMIRMHEQGKNYGGKWRQWAVFLSARRWWCGSSDIIQQAFQGMFAKNCQGKRELGNLTVKNQRTFSKPLHLACFTINASLKWIAVGCKKKTTTLGSC